MSIFEPVWKANEWKKKDKAISAVFRMHSAMHRTDKIGQCVKQIKTGG